MAATDMGGYIYTSTDSGVTWTQRTGSGVRDWRQITSSSDGTKLAAVVNGDYIYTSTDSGVTWTQRTGAGVNYWTDITSSSDGTKLAALGTGMSFDIGCLCFRDGYIYTSTDSGVTWTQRTGGSEAWFSITSSSDGTKLAAVDNDGGYIYTSTDSGVTWTQRASAGVHPWEAIASSADGIKLVAVYSANSAGYIYTSADSGVTWTQRNVGAGARTWISVASSADGVHLYASEWNNLGVGYIWSSADSGATWTQQSGISPLLETITTSADGSITGVAIANSYIVTNTDCGGLGSGCGSGGSGSTPVMIWMEF
jgi:hypothetical protein